MLHHSAQLRHAFRDQRANKPLRDSPHTAVIALIFWEDGETLCLCLGRRSHDPRDPWSGDFAFPGGRVEAQDKTLHDVAARETYEEIGLTLSAHTLIGRLDKTLAHSHRQHPVTVYPLIYLLDQAPVAFTMSQEMHEAHWLPANYFWDRSRWTAFSFPPTRAQRYGINVANHFLWGFSLQVIMDLGEVLGCSLQEIRVLETLLHIDSLHAG